jgi:hypothetical protein
MPAAPAAITPPPPDAPAPFSALDPPAPGMSWGVMGVSETGATGAPAGVTPGAVEFDEPVAGAPAAAGGLSSGAIQTGTASDPELSEAQAAHTNPSAMKAWDERKPNR